MTSEFLYTRWFYNPHMPQTLRDGAIAETVSRHGWRWFLRGGGTE